MRMLWLSSVALGALSGCTLGPNFSPPKADTPQSFLNGPPKPASDLPGSSLPVATPIDVTWWDVFHDPILSDLERRVAAQNLDVRVNAIRVAESRAQLGISRADAFPQANGTTSYERQKPSKRGVISLVGGGGSGGSSGGGSSGGGSSGGGSSGGGPSGGIPNSAIFDPYDLYQYGFDASWELDLWGRVRREVEGAQAQVAESEEARRDSLVQALAELARDYIQLRGAQEQLRITRENIDIAEQALKLTQERARGGLAPELDVANSAAQLESTRSQLPSQEAQVSQYGNAIALLLGQPPQALASQLDIPGAVPPAPPIVPVGLPAELARRRPDIRRAEANLHAATAQIGVAEADFYPRVTLSGNLDIQSLQFKDLGSWSQAYTYGFGPSISLPIFQGGRLTRTLELRQGQQQEAAVSYQRTVLSALHDVDNALTDFSAEQGRRAALQRAVEQNRRALGLARDQYAAGLTTFIDVIDVQRQLLSTEQQLATSTTTISTNLVALYKALGGGWQADLPEGSEPKPPGVLKTTFTP